MALVRPVLERHHVPAYICGHVHKLEYLQSSGNHTASFLINTRWSCRSLCCRHWLLHLGSWCHWESLRWWSQDEAVGCVDIRWCWIHDGSADYNPDDEHVCEYQGGEYLQCSHQVIRQELEQGITCYSIFMRFDLYVYGICHLLPSLFSWLVVIDDLFGWREFHRVMLPIK